MCGFYSHKSDPEINEAADTGHTIKTRGHNRVIRLVRQEGLRDRGLFVLLYDFVVRPLN